MCIYCQIVESMFLGNWFILYVVAYQVLFDVTDSQFVLLLLQVCISKRSKLVLLVTVLLALYVLRVTCVVDY